MYRITPLLAEELKEPWGDMISEEDAIKLPMNEVMTVGDMVSTTFLKHGLTPILMIFDYKTERRTFIEMDKYSNMLNDVFPCVVNPPGCITDKLENLVMSAVVDIVRFESPKQIMVMGEEDLAALLVIAYAPTDSKLVYGIPGRGMCVVNINREIRIRVNNILAKMLEK